MIWLWKKLNTNEVLIGKYRVVREIRHLEKELENRREWGIYAQRFDVECHLGNDLRNNKKGSIILVACHQVVKNLSEPSESTLVRMDIFSDYLREKDPKLDSTAVRAWLTTFGPRPIKLDGLYAEVYGPFPFLINVDDINIYTKAHVTKASDQVGQIYIRREDFVQTAMLEQDAVHIGYEADLAPHVLIVQGRKLSAKGPLDKSAAVIVMSFNPWTNMGFDRLELIPNNTRPAAANRVVIYARPEGHLSSRCNWEEGTSG